MNDADKLNEAVQWIMKSNLPPQERVLIIILLRNGLRVSEIANPSGIRKIDDWSVSVFCNKTKTYRTCMLAEAETIEREYQVLSDISLWQRNRFYYYRVLKGLLPDVDTQRTGNTAVTHAARNIRAQQTFEATQSIEAAQASLGHKSAKSTQSYLKPRQRGARVLKGVDNNVTGTIDSMNVTRTGVLRNKRGIRQ